MHAIDKDVVRSISLNYNFTESEVIGFIELLISEYFALVLKRNVIAELKPEQKSYYLKIYGLDGDVIDFETFNKYIIKEMRKYLTYNLEFFKLEREFVYYKLFHLRNIKCLVTSKTENGFWLSFKPADVFPLKFENHYAKNVFIESKLYAKEYKMFLPFDKCTHRDLNNICSGMIITCYAGQIKPVKQEEIPFIYLNGIRNNLKVVDLLLVEKLLNLKEADQYIVKCTIRKAGKESFILSNKSIPKDIISSLRTDLFGESIKVQYGDFEIPEGLHVKLFKNI